MKLGLLYKTEPKDYVMIQVLFQGPYDFNV